ncbi:MAG: adenylate/guanylate cyclase domain-containing protein [Roseobacter sp.]
MECLNCATVNREGRRFCSNCGGALPVACSACNFLNDANDAFCGGCGASMEALPAVVAQRSSQSVKSYAFEGDRRQLTVMFCDLVGSTLISERLDPEEMTGLLTAYRIACAEVVEQFGGFIGNFMGDGLLIYFGYPQAHEDDPQRAIRAALRIIAAVEELNNDFSMKDVRLNVRIGVNTGLVVAADIGAGEQREKMAIVGDTPNIAARLQSLAEPGTVVIGRRTHRLIEGLFVCEALGPQALKGISDPMDVYRVCESTEARSSFEAKLQKGLTPMAGRKEEIGLLVNRWDQAKTREGQVVMVSGEPGVGKSRVLENFQSYVLTQNCRSISFVCSNYRQDTPFHPFVDFMERTLKADANNDPAAMLDKLDAFLGDLDLNVPEFGSLLAAMLNLPASGRYNVPILTLEDQKNKTLKALVSIVEALSSDAPLLILVEDLQWADHSTREFLELLVDHVRTSQILVVLAFRADFEPPWSKQPHLTIMRLRHLSRSESVELIEGVTGGRALPSEVLEHILSKTDGVPLFIEELTKLVMEMDLLELHEGEYMLTGPLQTTAIPDSLQDSLMARLDHLGTAKEAAQLASVLGRTFGHALMLAVTQKSEEALDRALTRLVDSELLYRRGLAPEIVYEFKHALVKDAAYEGLLHSKRRQLHMDIASILEARFPHMSERSPELLSYHYKEAGDVEQAIPYSFKAGDAAADRYAATEASAHYQSALDMAKSIQSTENSARCQIRAILKLANVASTRDQFERNLGNLGMARALAEKIDHQVRLCQIQYWTARTYYVLGRFNLAVDLAKQALDLAEKLGNDDSMRTGPVNLLARVYCLLGEPTSAIDFAAQSVEQMRATGDRVEEAAVSGVLSFALAQNGQYEAAIDAANHGVALAQELDHLPTVAACLMFRGLVNGWFGRLSDATPDFEQSIYVCEQSGDVFRKYLTLGWHGEACLVAGEIVAARNNLEQCLALGSQLGTSFHRGAFEAFLAKALLAQGETEKAMCHSEAAVATATESGETWPRSIALRISTEVQIASASPDIGAAQAAISSAINIQSERDCKCDLAWSHLVNGQILAAKGDHKDAVAAYRVSHDMFDSLNIDRGIELSKTAIVSLKGVVADA